MVKVDLALVHYPVTNKNREQIGSAVTNLDIHDIARAGRTYGIDNFYLVTPYKDQQQLIQEIVDHWLEGHGAQYNANRKDALEIVRICNDLDELFDCVQVKWGEKPQVITTTAQTQRPTVSYTAVRQEILAGRPSLLLLGTAWGLAEEVFTRSDCILEPITGNQQYNHLSVRSAAAIILDRLIGNFS